MDTSLLQPDLEGIVEPHPTCMALLSESVFVANATLSDSDTMNLEDAMAAPDREQFLEAMSQVLQDHVDRKYWKVVSVKSIARNKHALPMVWAMN